MVKYKLQYPIEWDGKTIDTLAFRRPKGKHIKKLGSSLVTEDLMILASKLCDESSAVFDEMDAADVLKISELVGNFLDSGQKTGSS